MEIDIRVLAPTESRHAVHLGLRELGLGRTLRIISDHDLRSLRHELERTHPGCFAWTYVESSPHAWQVDILKTHDFEPFDELDLLADSPGLRIAQIRVPAGGTKREMGFAGGAALIFDEGAGLLEVSGRRSAIAVGTVEIVCPGERCTVSAATDLHAYVAMVK
jgi:uncharacterized protein (DUF2249 family)